jgi:hypothetical protein
VGHKPRKVEASSSEIPIGKVDMMVCIEDSTDIIVIGKRISVYPES